MTRRHLATGSIVFIAVTPSEVSCVTFDGRMVELFKVETGNGRRLIDLSMDVDGSIMVETMDRGDLAIEKHGKN